MKEIVFQRDALEQEIRLARTRSARLASEPPPPAIKWISDSHRRLSEKLIKEISEQPLRSPEECIAQLERLAKKQPPLVPETVDFFRSLASSPDGTARVLLAELRRLKANPAEPHSKALALFMHEAGGLALYEQNFLSATADQVLQGVRERRRRSILERVIRHAGAAGLLGQ